MTRTSMMPLILLFLAVVSSVSGRELFRCGYKRCDRELQYCDMELKDCVECIHVCRRGQHRSMDQLCEKECPLYFKRRRAEEAIAKPDIVITTEPPRALPASSEQKAPIGTIGICTLAGLAVIVILIVIAIPLFLKYRQRIIEKQPRRIQPETVESAAMTDQPSTPAEPATIALENEEEGERKTLLNPDDRMQENRTAEGSYATTLRGRKIACPEDDHTDTDDDRNAGINRNTVNDRNTEIVDSGLTNDTTTTPSNSPPEPAPNQATGPDVADDTDIAQPNDGTDEEIQAPGGMVDSAAPLNLTEPGQASETSDSEEAVHVLSFVRVHDGFEGPASCYYPSQDPSFEPDDSFLGLVSNPGTTPTPQESDLPSVHRGRRRRLSSGNG